MQETRRGSVLSEEESADLTMAQVLDQPHQQDPQGEEEDLKRGRLSLVVLACSFLYCNRLVFARAYLKLTAENAEIYVCVDKSNTFLTDLLSLVIQFFVKFKFRSEDIFEIIRN